MDRSPWVLDLIEASLEVSSPVCISVDHPLTPPSGHISSDVIIVCLAYPIISLLPIVQRPTCSVDLCKKPAGSTSVLEQLPPTDCYLHLHLHLHLRRHRQRPRQTTPVRLPQEIKDRENIRLPLFPFIILQRLSPFCPWPLAMYII